MNRIAISFSGGLTSAYMTHRLLQERRPETEYVVIFANTGQEHERTLEFVNLCDRKLHFNTVWIEAVTDPRARHGQRAKMVTFDTASRSGEPFEAVIAKHGIPNRNFPHCTRELKTRPIQSYLKHQMGWPRSSYFLAIGIRADEMDRVNPNYAKEKIIYPLLNWEITKSDVRRFWRGMPFTLDIPEHLGNCTWCWKKSLKKHLTLARDFPNFFDFPAEMMRKYPDAGPGTMDRPRRFFRGNRTVDDLIQMAKEPFDDFIDNEFNACEESCEIMGATP